MCKKLDVIWVNGDKFVLVRASNLSLGDTFLDYVPKTFAEMDLMEKIKKVIRDGVKDF